MMKFKYKFKKLRVIINNKLYKKHTPDSNEVLIKKTIASLLCAYKTIQRALGCNKEKLCCLEINVDKRKRSDYSRTS